MNKFRILLAGTAGILFFAITISCDKKVGKTKVEEVTPPPVAGFCDSITYNKHIKKIITANCAIPTCHVPGGGGSGDFTSFSVLSSKVSSGLFKARVFDLPAGDPSIMPPPSNGGKLAQSKLDSIKCWLDKGALND